MKDSKTKGAGFIIAVVTSLFVLTGGVMVLNYIPFQLKGERAEYAFLVKRHIAESGIYQAMANLQNEKKANFEQNFDRGKFTVEISELTPEKWRITSSAVLSNKDKSTAPILIETVVVKKDGKLDIRKWVERKK